MNGGLKEIVWGFVVALIPCAGVQAAGKPNVLFIAIDDLRPALKCYGVEQAVTPNMDALAASGRMFMSHYVQVPTCGASRYSMLAGVMPRVVSDNKNAAGHQLYELPDDKARTMPELFRNNGYRTVCLGKISHSTSGYGKGKYSKTPDVPGAWNELLTPTTNRNGLLVSTYSNGRARDEEGGFIPMTEFPEVADNELQDGMFADAAIERLKKFGESKEPFFMGVGFIKPHLPFVAPKKYRDLYDGVAFPSKYGMKRGDTKKAGKSGEFYKYVTNRPWKTPAKGEAISEEDAQEVRRAYYACVSYVDAQVGRVLNALDEAGLADNTIVVLWGDHGWHLGENNAWAKHTALEMSMRSPLMIRVPGMKAPGQTAEKLAASVDIYPTLIELCGLENRETAQPLEGQSLIPMLDNPKATVRNEVLSFWYSTSMTDGRYRLIVSKNKKGEGYEYELYDYETDPGGLVNIASKNPELLDRLMSRLKSVYPQIVLKP